MGQAPYIEIDHLSKSYSFGRVRALDDVSLSIHSGEIFGLIGQNGAGKTTLMGCMLGLLWPTSGSVKIDSRSVNDLSIKATTGFMPERPNFDKWMTVKQFLQYHHLLSGQSFASARENIESALHEVNLEEAAWGRRIIKLSRGMLQRVGLAQILITKPRLCFLDEPTSGMDPIGMALVRELLLKWREQGATVVLNSHHLDEVEKVCDRVAFIHKGKIQAIEDVRAVDAANFYIIKWDPANQDAVSNGIFDDLAAALSVTVESKDDASVRLRLSDPKIAPEVIKFLVSRNVAITEAAYEKRALLDLFVESSRSP